MPRHPADRIISRCSSWEDFTSALEISGRSPLANRFRGDAFERLIQLYLQTEPEYVSKLKSVWLLEEVPSRVRSHLNLPGHDEGIDLIAETRDGAFWSIQAKYRTSNQSTLTKSELDSFSTHSFVHCTNIDFGLVAHTVLKPIRKRHLLGNISELGLDTWLGLDDEKWKRLRQRIRLKSTRPRGRKPKKHQRAAIEAASRHFVEAKAKRGRLIMPCGTGKSLTAFWIARKLGAKTILVAVPSLALIRQSLADWTREFLAVRTIPEWLCVCSSEDVGKLDADEFVGETYELGVPTTTDVAQIAAFLRKRTKATRVVFTTYQSGRRLADAAKAARSRFDLAIFDEAHKTVGPKGKAFALLLDESQLRVKRRLFMTATERVLAGGRSDDVLSMDDSDAYGDRFFELSFKQAIADGLICDYRILTVTVSEHRVRELIEDRRFVDLGEDLEERDAQEIAAGLALKKAVKERGVRHAISFHSSIRSARRFASQQDVLNKDRKLGPRIANLHISSKNSVGERADLLREFPTHARSLLSNARCLTEGVDIPEVDCVLFANPKQSVVDIVQAAGRAMRRHEGKSVGYILLPLVVPDDMDLERFADTTAFRQVARTITALSTQDERIAEEFRALEGRPASSGKLVQIEGDVHVGIKAELRDFASMIGTKVWERVGRANWRSFEEARAFAQGLALTSVPDWQRYAKRGVLPPDIPTDPSRHYRDRGWVNWGDWIGSYRVANQNKEFRSFDKARRFARGLRLSSVTGWRHFCRKGKLPHDLPANPDVVYRKDGWKSWGDWLGTRHRRGEWRPFHQARSFVRSLGFVSWAEWLSYARSNARPLDIPVKPERVYVEVWQGKHDWLGRAPSPQVAEWLPLEEARRLVRRLGLKNQAEWLAAAKSGALPAGIPATPWNVYGNTGWTGLGDWLGTGRLANREKTFRDFSAARRYARGLNCRHSAHWRRIAKAGKLPPDIPRDPYTVYGKLPEWRGMGDFLGTGNVRTKEFLSYTEARELVRRLGLRTSTEWQAYSSSGRRRADIPSNPHVYYRGNGWTSWPDWLGTNKQK